MTDRKYPGCSVERAECNIKGGLSQECKRCLRERPLRELRSKCKGWDRTDGGFREFEYGWDA